MSVAWQVKYQQNPVGAVTPNGTKLQGTSNGEYGNWFSRNGRSSSPISTLARLQRGGVVNKYGSVGSGSQNGYRHNPNAPIYDIPNYNASSANDNTPGGDGKRFYSFITKVSSDNKDPTDTIVPVSRYDIHTAPPGSHVRRPVETPTNSPQLDRRFSHLATRQVGPVKALAAIDDSVLSQTAQRSPRSPRSPRQQTNSGLSSGGGSSLQRSHTMSDFDNQRRLESGRYQDLRRQKTFHDTPTWRQTMMKDEADSKALTSPNVASRNMLPSFPSSNTAQGLEPAGRHGAIVPITSSSRHPIGSLGRQHHDSAKLSELSPKTPSGDYYKYMINEDANSHMKYPKNATLSDYPSRYADNNTYVTFDSNSGMTNSGASFTGSITSLNGINSTLNGQNNALSVQTNTLKGNNSLNGLSNTYSGHTSSLSGHTNTINSPALDSTNNLAKDVPNNALLDKLIRAKAKKSILKKKSSYDSIGRYDIPSWNGSTTIKMGGLERALPQLRGNMPYNGSISYFAEPSPVAEEQKRTATSGSGKRVTFAM